MGPSRPFHAPAKLLRLVVATGGLNLAVFRLKVEQPASQAQQGGHCLERDGFGDFAAVSFRERLDSNEQRSGVFWTYQFAGLRVPDAYRTIARSSGHALAVG